MARPDSTTSRILLAGLVMTASGALDDLRGKTALPRILWPALAAALLMPGWSGGPTVLSWLLTFAWLIVMTQGFHAAASLAGLASGSAGIASFFFGLYALTTSRPTMALVAFALSGAALGFLPFGYRLRAREGPVVAALGESGTRVLGLASGTLGLLGNWTADGTRNILVPVLILAIPLIGFALSSRRATAYLFRTGALSPPPAAPNLGIRRQELVLLLFIAGLCLGSSALLYRGAPLFDALLIVGQVFIVLGVSAFGAVVMIRRQRSARS